jgi:phosphoglycolate phosphatase
MVRPFVIFDFDGTVADSLAESLAAYNRVAPRLHLRQVQEAELPELRSMAPGHLMQVLGIPMWKLPRLMLSVRAELLDHSYSVKPVAGITQALHDLCEAGCPMAMVTSNSELNVRNFLSRLGISPFDSIVAGASIFGKATRLRRMLKAAKTDPSFAVYIGDTVPDIRAAREAGTAAVAVAWGFSASGLLKNENPDALVSAAADLPSAILRLFENR